MGRHESHDNPDRLDATQQPTLTIPSLSADRGFDEVKIVRLASYPIRSTNGENLICELLSRIENGVATALFFANTNLIVKCRFILSNAALPSVIIVNDGIGLDIAAKLFKKTTFAENLNGTDFVPRLFQSASKPLKIFMIGGSERVVDKAAIYVQESLKQEVVGTCNGYAEFRDNETLVHRLNMAAPDVVLVALGNPMQEKWILDHGLKTRGTVFIGVGALFDFWSGDKPRAPTLIRRLRLEWLYRLYLEPRRLMRRYTVDIGVFLWCCFWYK